MARLNKHSKRSSLYKALCGAQTAIGKGTLKLPRATLLLQLTAYTAWPPSYERHAIAVRRALAMWTANEMGMTGADLVSVGAVELAVDRRIRQQQNSVD